ncbi:MAG: hypothetical protein AAF730_20010 [Bacteroidota bacterium]
MFCLPSGEPVAVRPVTSADQWRFRRVWAEMSPRTRYLRFHGGHLSEDGPCIRYLTDVDQQLHVAHGAILADHPDHPGVGVFRFIRPRLQAAHAELAITVVDGYQQQGVGRYLLGCAADEAARRSIEQFTFRILAGRHRLHAGLQRVGAVVHGFEDGALVYSLPITSVQDRAATPLPPRRQTGWPGPVEHAG